MTTTQVARTDILVPGPVLGTPQWLAQIHAWCRYRHCKKKDPLFPNWNEVRGPGYVVWFSEPRLDPANRGWLIRVERTKSSTAAGVEIYEGLISTTLRVLPGATVVATQPES